jgi:hypothetical protein
MLRAKHGRPELVKSPSQPARYRNHLSLDPRRPRVPFQRLGCWHDISFRLGVDRNRTPHAGKDLCGLGAGA